MPMPAPPGDASASRTGRATQIWGQDGSAGEVAATIAAATSLIAGYPAAPNTGAMKTDTSVETPSAPGDEVRYSRVAGI